MDSSDLALLLGLGLGGFGGYLGNQRRRDREREDRKQDILDDIEIAKLLQEEEKKILEQEKYDADTKKFKREGRFTEGDRRGELENPGFFDMFGAEYDPVHDYIEENFGLRAADFLTGTTAYDTSLPIDERIRNPESENFVENRANNFFTDFGVLPYSPLLTMIPGLAPATLGGIGTALGARGLMSLAPGVGSRMMANLKNYLRPSTGGAPSGTAPSIPSMAYSGMNQGGRVGLSQGTNEEGRGVFDAIDRAVDVGADFITRLRRGVVRPEDYDAEGVPEFIKYFNPLDFIGTFNEATGLQRLLMGADQQADQRVLDIFGTPNPNYDPDVVGTGEILDPLLMQMYGFPQDTRDLED